MKVVEGDLVKMAVNGDFDVILHGCNCFCTMGKGIAKAIRDTFPLAYETDKWTKKGDPHKLGTISYATCPQVIVVNCYTQYKFYGAKHLADYSAITRCFRTVSETFDGKRIAYPMIGAGLAGGDWNKISQIINTELAGQDHTLVKFKG